MEQERTIDQITEDYALSRVPEDKLRNWWAILAVQFGMIFGSTVIIWTVQYSQVLTFRDIIIAFVVGHAIVFVIFMQNGMLGIRERLSTYVLAEQSFGRIGASLISILLAFALMGWMGTQVAAAADAICAATGWNPVLVNVVVGLLMTFTATWGFQGLKRLSDIAVPLFVVVSIAGTVIAWNKIGGIQPLLMIQPTGHMSMKDAISGVIGSIVVMGVITPDITRYCRSDFDWFIGAFISFSIGHMVFPIAGSLMGYAAQSGDAGKVLFSLTGWLGVLSIVLAGWTSGDNNIYSASLGMTQVIPKAKRWHLALTLGILGTLLAVGGILKYLIKWMVLLSAIAPPLFAVMQADYWFLPLLGLDRSLAGKSGAQVNIAAILSWAIGVAAFYKISWGLAVVNSSIVTMIAYCLISVVYYRVFGRSPLIGVSRLADKKA